MEYEMEDLLPIVRRLAEKYCGYEHTSMTYERAQQLMEAVLYCIREAESCQEAPLAAAGGLPAARLYETGAACVERKVNAALDLYHEILPTFECYGNRCLRDTFVKGLPEFFKWYDIRFAPQDTILTLDYPVLKDLSGYTGIDRIYAFLECIRLEQMFLKTFPQGYVSDVLSSRDYAHEDMIENICEVVFTNMIGQALKKPSSPDQFSIPEDSPLNRETFRWKDSQDIRHLAESAATDFVRECCGGCAELEAYLIGCVRESFTILSGR